MECAGPPVTLCFRWNERHRNAGRAISERTTIKKEAGLASGLREFLAGVQLMGSGFAQTAWFDQSRRGTATSSI